MRMRALFLLGIVCISFERAACVDARRMRARVSLKQLNLELLEARRTLANDKDTVRRDEQKLLADEESVIQLQDELISASGDGPTKQQPAQQPAQQEQVVQAQPAIELEDGAVVQDTEQPQQVELQVEDASEQQQEAVEETPVVKAVPVKQEQTTVAEKAPVQEAAKETEKVEPAEKEPAEKVEPAAKEADHTEKMRFQKGADTDRMRSALKAFFNKHNPEKLSNIDKIVEKYSGKANELSDRLMSKYGAKLQIAPAADKSADEFGLLEEQETTDVTKKALVKAQLLHIYATHEPSKLPFVESIMQMYEGQETELLKKVRQKYSDLV